MDERRLLDANELAQKLGVHPATVFRLRKEGLPYIKVSPKVVRYDLEDVVAWMKARGQKE